MCETLKFYGSEGWIKLDKKEKSQQKFLLTLSTY